MPDDVAALFADAALGRSTRCAHCLNASWKRAIRDVIDRLDDGRLPIALSMKSVYDRLAGADAETAAKFGFDRYAQVDGTPWAFATFMRHIREHEKEVWGRVRRKKQSGGYCP